MIRTFQIVKSLILWDSLALNSLQLKTKLNR
jgi:hypothetical protein